MKNIAEIQELKEKPHNEMHLVSSVEELPEILFITTYPPRECGIATYSQDLIQSLKTKFSYSFSVKICAVESKNENHHYPEEVKYILKTNVADSFHNLATKVNADHTIQMVLVQHEFGLFRENETHFNHFLEALGKPVILVFHSVLPNPDTLLTKKIQEMTSLCEAIIVMTNSSRKTLENDYAILPEKISVIAHGTHLIQHKDKELLKIKHKLSNKRILSTFGLLSSGKSIETTLEALPEIIKKNPDVFFLIIGKTHPSVLKNEGEQYREMLMAKINALQLEPYVQFVNCFLPLSDLLEYLQLTDIYLFTSKDPNQAVSGTFSYAISCGCAIVSTPIPHANEVLQNDIGIRIDFGNSKQLEQAVIRLLDDELLRKKFSANGLNKMASTAWENAAIAHAQVFEKFSNDSLSLQYTMPEINLDHIKKLTTDFGIIQFCKMNQPDIDSGYTLDDNARALIALCQHFEITKNEADMAYILRYYNFIKYCLQPEGYFLNYVNEQHRFTRQNSSANLADANGRAIWALGFLISLSAIIPKALIADAEETLQKALPNVNNIHSTRAMAFIIKGVHYYNTTNKSAQNILIIRELANRLVQMYRHESDKEWLWFESYFTYANSILSEALLCAWLTTGEPIYKEIAKSSFDFLLFLTFKDNEIKVISNKTWLHKGSGPVEETTNHLAIGGEQPIDVAYTILALSKFHEVFNNDSYLYKMEMSFNWFLGNNHLKQIIYNPCTGGCYDGLEEKNVNINQGAESTVSYLMARLAVEKSFQSENKIIKIPITLRSNISKKKHFLKLNG